MIKRGDVMFRHGKFHHTLVVTDPKNFADPGALAKPGASQKIEVIHAASVDSGVFREELDVAESEAEGNSFTFYRPVAPCLANGVEFAMLWAHYRSATGKITREKAKGPVTYYSYDQITKSGADKSRYSGVQSALHQNVSPPFEFDALYRAFKWATRQRTGFSKERGTTCCAFITACFQAAAVDHCAKSYKNLEKGLELLRELRGEKLPKDKRDLEFVEMGARSKKVALTALPQFANPGGFKKFFTVNDYCRFVTKELLGAEKTVQDIFPAGLLVDAKFNYSKNFERMIAMPNSGFMKVL